MESDDLPSEQVLVTADVVARWLGTTPRHVQRLVTEKRIPYVKVGHFVRFDPQDVEHWIHAHKVETVEEVETGQPIWVTHRPGSMRRSEIAPRARSRKAPAPSNTDRH